jgi:hypothetical protein
MITAIRLAVKSFLGPLIEFIAKYWQFFLMAVVSFAAFHYYQKADQIQFEYDQHIIGDEKAASDRKLENYFKEQAHKKEVDRANAEGKAELAKYKLNRDRETKNLKDLYEKRLDSTGRNWSERVRLEQERQATDGMPTPRSDTSGFAEGERECYAAYTTLENGCRVTTIDYNRLRKWGDSVCDLVGCKSALTVGKEDNQGN